MSGGYGERNYHNGEAMSDLLDSLNADQRRIQQERIVAGMREKLEALTKRVEALENAQRGKEKKHNA